MATHRYIKVDTIDSGLHVEFEDKFLYGDIVAEILKLELLQLFRDEQPKIVIIDFSDVRSISSSVIGALMSVRTKLMQSGGQLRFCEMPPSIEGVFKTLNLYGTVFQVFPTANDAAQATRNTLAPQIAMELDEE